MKKIICIIITSIIILSATTFAQETTLTQGEKINSRAKEAAEFLNLLNITDFSPDNLTGDMTRQQFIKIVYNMTGLGEQKGLYEGKSLFTDVAADNEYASYIYTAVDMGLISGFKDGSFKPQDKISVMEAVTVLIKLLGYGYKAELKGGYPSGYLAVSNDIKLIKYINCGYKDTLTNSDAAILCLNALKVDIMKQTGFGKDKKTMEVQNDVNLLYENFNIRHISGTVDGIDITRLRGINNIPPHHVLINGILLDAGDTNVNSYLGYNVDAYFIEDKDKDADVLKYVCKKENGNEETVVKISDLKDISNYSVRVRGENGKTEKYSYTKTAAIIYNGVSTTAAFNMDMFNGKTGILRLLDNNNDGNSEVLFVDVYENYVVSQRDVLNSKIFDYYDKNKSIELDLKEDDPYVLIFDSEGNSIPFSKISEFAVVSVYSSLPDAYQKFIKAYVSDNKVTGEIESVEYLEDSVILTLNSETYELTENCFKQAEKDISIGDAIELVLDKNGFGAYVKFVSDGETQYGYIVDACKKNGLNGKIEFKIFTSEGNFKIFTAADRLTIDDVIYKNSDAKILTSLNNSYKIVTGTAEKDCYAQLIRYSLKNDGELCYIDTVANDDKGKIGSYETAKGKNALYMIKGDSLYYYTGPRSFGGKILAPQNSIVFRHPPTNDPDVDYKDEDLYKVSSMNYFTNAERYSVRAYYSKQGNVSPEVFTTVYDGKGVWRHPSTPVVIFDSTTDVIDEKGEKVKKIKFYENGMKKELLCKSDVTYIRTVENPDTAPNLPKVISAQDLVCGDMFRYIEGKTDYITTFELIYRAQTDTMITRHNSLDLRIVSGYAYSVFDDGLKFKVTDNVLDLENNDNFEFIKPGSYPVLLYDSSALNSKLKLQAASYDNIMGYAETGAGCSKVIIQEYYYDPKIVYVVK